MSSEVPTLAIPPAQAFLRLTPEQRTVCELLAHGHSNAEIAMIRHRSKKTANRHVMAIMTNLQLHRRALVTRWWWQHYSQIQELKETANRVRHLARTAGTSGSKTRPLAGRPTQSATSA